MGTSLGKGSNGGGAGSVEVGGRLKFTDLGGAAMVVKAVAMLGGDCDRVGNGPEGMGWRWREGVAAVKMAVIAAVATTSIFFAIRT